ncbi:DUF3179 domain-containing protein [Candidatus Uhrbacteria bacterium]|nr:DUF3179 domain-containing protein [Candidatus Uhrbacteria bacterium]
MDKKRLIAIALGTAVVVVGLLVAIRAKRLVDTAPEERAMNDALLAEALVEDGKTYLIPPEEMYESGLTSEDVPALTDPSFTTIAAMDGVLADEVYGIDVEVDGVHRFYSQQILNWHRVVNDTEAGLAITFDPLTGAAVVYQVQKESGEMLRFDVSGKVYNNGMLLADGRGDLWWQMEGVLVVAKNGGDMPQTVGEELTQYPSQSIRWMDWKELYPSGEVLSDATGFDRDYTRHPYGQYTTTMNVYFPVSSTDERIPGSKWAVYGLSINGEELAIPKLALYKEPAEGSDEDPGPRLYNATLGGMHLVALYDHDLDVVHVFSTDMNGGALSFSWDAEREVYVDDATGSTWSATGIATAGELRGASLVRMNAPEYYWFAWAAAHPDTRVAVLDENPLPDEDD